MVTGPVHFIYLGGVWVSQFTRAVKTARRHDAPVILWSAVEALPKLPDVEVRPLELGEALLEHPIKLANVKDLFMWHILHRYGGLYLDLDTISLRPVWDLLGDFEACVSTEFPPGDEAGRPHNTAAVIAKRGADVVADLADEAMRILNSGVERWGAIGPHLVSDFAATHETITAAPYRALNGWSYHDIGDYYANPRDPGEDVRVIHLYSSDHLEEFHADRWVP